ncbi:unnamed protein product [Clonostachys byssicola]|uniref:Maltose/galactoside acetyltransferase domain-containing protein n=1 Tax=Clonostachys byssicola TaxID=160290 RepID=A0A9N9Y6Y2_9HYPO|nr:unnamed protein product [Clonostachys byssicola]
MAVKDKSVRELDKAKSLAHVPWCDEYEKMISGMLYDAGASELAVARFKARKWTMHYNSFFPEDARNAEEVSQARRKLLGGIIGEIDGDDICIEPPFSIDYGCSIKFGKRFYANFNLCILDCAIITIGDRVMLGPNVSIFGATHETDVQSRREGVEFARPVTIGDDCWIGGHSVILPGVTIGKGCTVAAGSIVTKDVPDWSVVMGQPAKVVRTVQAID